MKPGPSQQSTLLSFFGRNTVPSLRADVHGSSDSPGAASHVAPPGPRPPAPPPAAILALSLASPAKRSPSKPNAKGARKRPRTSSAAPAPSGAHALSSPPRRAPALAPAPALAAAPGEHKLAPRALAPWPGRLGAYSARFGPPPSPARAAQVPRPTFDRFGVRARHINEVLQQRQPTGRACEEEVEDGDDGGSPLSAPAEGAEAELDESKLSPEQLEALRLAEQGDSFFFTGPGGTGKSFLIRALVHRLRALHSPDTVFITASTGVAACSLGGVTLHSFAGVGLAEAPAEKMAEELMNNAQKRRARARWQAARVLIVDEVSMLCGAFFAKLEQLARLVRGRPDEPWGGLQLILAGDFLQLPPVRSPLMAFETDAWRRTVRRVVHLRTVFRQADAAFVALLNEVRLGTLSDASVRALQARVGLRPPPGGLEPTRLFPTKAGVEEANRAAFDALAGEVLTWQAASKALGRDYAQQLEHSCPAPALLRLKLGAQVMLLKNLDVAEQLFNGARGVVVRFETDAATQEVLPVAAFASGLQSLIHRALFSLEVGGRVVASREQLPLSLAWALSVHKSQGMSLDAVEASLDDTFECGQAYVALSRARFLEGLYLKSFPGRQCIRVHQKALAFYRATSLAPAAPSAADKSPPRLLSLGTPSPLATPQKSTDEEEDGAEELRLQALDEAVLAAPDRLLLQAEEPASDLAAADVAEQQEGQGTELAWALSDCGDDDNLPDA